MKRDDLLAGLAARRIAYRHLVWDNHMEELASAQADLAKADFATTSVVRGQIARLLDIIDQRVERRVSAVQAGARHSCRSKAVRFLQRIGLVARHNGELRGHETTQELDLDLEKIEAVLNCRLVFRQCVAPNDPKGTTPAALSAHRLCEVSK